MAALYRGGIMRKVIRKEVATGGRFDFFWTLSKVETKVKKLKLICILECCKIFHILSFLRYQIIIAINHWIKIGIIS